MSLTEYKLNPKVEEESRLQTFIENGNSKELLVYFQENPDVSDSLLYKCLYKAITSNAVNITRIIFAAGADISHGNHYRLLSAAVETKNIDTIQILIEEKINIELPESLPTISTLLQSAVLNGDLEILKLLLNPELRLTCVDVEGFSAMHTAAEANKDAIQVLVDGGCDVNVQSTKKGYTPLHCAVQKNSAEIVEFLLELGADPGLADHSVGNTPLHYAVLQDNKELIELLLKKMKPDQINHLNQLCKSCLHMAASENKTHLIKLLIDAGARSDIQNDDENTAPMCAVESGHVTCAMELLCCTPRNHLWWSCVGNKNTQGNTILHILAQKGKTCHELLEYIVENLQNDVILNEINHHGETAVMVATKHDNIQAVALFIIAGADVNIGCDNTGSPLHSAILLGHDVARVVLESPLLQLETCDADGETALHKAAFIGNFYMLEAMLDKGVSVEILNKQCLKGNTIIHYLVENSTNDQVLQLIRRLVDEGLALEVTNKNGDNALIHATQNKSQNVQSIEELLKLGAQVNVANKKGKCALHYTCELKRTYVSYCLLEYGADCNTQDKAGNTPLHLAAANEDDEIVLRLLMKKCDLDILNNSGMTALHTAACTNTAVVKILIEQGASIEVPGAVSSPLIHAAMRGHLDIVNMLLAQGANTNLVDKQGRTALMWASQNGYVDCMKQLIQHGADPKLTDESGDTALTITAWSGHVDAMEILLPLSDLDHCEKEEGMSALYLAIAKDRNECVRMLLDAGADINLIDHYGNTALLTAAMLTKGSQILDMILECGKAFNINAVGDKGRTAIHWAVGEPDCVRLLVEHLPKPDLNVLDDNKASPLLLAVAHGQPESAEILILAGCDINMIHVDGRSAIHHAAIYGDPATTQLLINKGIKPDTPMQDGRRPLLLASIENNVKVLEILLKYDVALNLIYNESFTALSTAISNHFDDVVQILLKSGADPNIIGPGKHLPLIHAVIEDYNFGIVSLIQAGASVDVQASEGRKLMEIAILNKSQRVVQILLEVGSDPNHLQTILKDGMFVYFIEDDLLLNAIRFLAKQPRSLHILCRDVLRQSVQKPLASTLKKVSLPQRLKDYVLLSELKEKWIRA